MASYLNPEAIAPASPSDPSRNQTYWSSFSESEHQSLFAVREEIFCIKSVGASTGVEGSIGSRRRVLKLTHRSRLDREGIGISSRSNTHGMHVFAGVVTTSTRRISGRIGDEP